MFGTHIVVARGFAAALAMLSGVLVGGMRCRIPGIDKVSPSKSKYDRAFAASDELNSGCWYLPHPQIAPWVDQFLFELSAFPRGKHDYWLDAWTQAREALSECHMWHFT